MTTRQVQAHLPPRCPIQKKPINGPIHDGISLPSQHRRSSSQYMLEEQPAWLDDLLSDPESNSKERFHRRSASDSLALLDGLSDSLSSLGHHNDEGTSVNGSCVLESDCLYGPNSPRQRSSSSSENAIVSALSEYVYQEHMQFVDGSPCISGITCSDAMTDGCPTVGEHNAETKAAKRHPGQRSRIRKLQYIAELERTVNDLQTVESELAVRVASLLQQRAALSMENSKLKQQLARLRQEKLIVDDQYQFLKKEVKRLKNGLTNYPNNKFQAYFGSTTNNAASRLDAMQMALDMEKLNIN
ncbi:hypothetical protein FEM48_Zijuj03G0035100 [Ziziphus jujuba var. spinosa]|uniref:Basic leucine zipper 2 n=1 Tax=Ziziphus jujuba var. spinosa TaxID=714518 RepID=A0A978VMX6_ZIZJJ|nr:hypothetical protein FEM48_Zijuj03G0035100 [Ziziphus jujuba var. spinosa]